MEYLPNMHKGIVLLPHRSALTGEVGGTYLGLPEEFARGLPFPTKSGEPPWRTAAALCPAGSLLEA